MYLALVVREIVHAVHDLVVQAHDPFEVLEASENTGKRLTKAF
jgi:hypothetical protein